MADTYVNKDGLTYYTGKVKSEINAAETRLRALVGTPLVANTAASMTDTDKIYVYTGSETGYTAGNWYYHNGTAWVSGGVYNSAAVETDKTLSVPDMAADAKAVGDGIGGLKSTIKRLEDGRTLLDTAYVHGRILTTSGSEGIVQQSETYKYQAVTPNSIVLAYDAIINVNPGYQFLVFFYDDNDTYVKRTGSWQTSSYQIAKNQKIRLFITLNPQDNTANVDATVFAQQITITSMMSAKITAIEDTQRVEGDRIDLANNGEEFIDTIFSYGQILTSTGHVGEVITSTSTSKYQVVTPNAISFSNAKKIIAKPGYAVQIWWYDENDVYVSRTGSFVTEYTLIPNRKYRFFIRFNPHDTSAVMDFSDVRNSVIVLSNTGERITNLETAPLTTFPNYILGMLASKPLGSFSKGYILLSFDDGAKTLATGTIPLLIENDVPGTFGLLPQSEIFAEGNETELATVIDAVQNHGCVVAMHGSVLWPTYAESALYDYFTTTIKMFEDYNLGEIYGAICPGGNGDDTSALVKVIAGACFGFVFSGNRNDKISYDSVGVDGKFNGARSNRFDLDRRSGTGITTSKAHDIVAYAAENHLLLCPFWHDDTLNDISHAEYITYFNNLIMEAKTAGLQFITTRDLPNII